MALQYESPPFNVNFFQAVIDQVGKHTVRGTAQRYVNDLEAHAIQLYRQMVGRCATLSAGEDEYSGRINAFQHTPGVSEVRPFIKNPECAEEIRELCSTMIHYRLAESFFQTTRALRNTTGAASHMFQAVFWMELLAELDAAYGPEHHERKASPDQAHGDDSASETTSYAGDPTPQMANILTKLEKGRRQVLHAQRQKQAENAGGGVKPEQPAETKTDLAAGREKILHFLGGGAQRRPPP